VGEDVRPGGLSEHKEHQDVDEPQKINIERPDTFVSGGRLNKRFEGEVHGITRVGWVSAAWEPNSITERRLREHALSQRQRQGSLFHLVTPSSTTIQPKKNPRL